MHTYPIARFFMETLLRVEGIANTSVLSIAFGATVGQLVMAALALYTLRDVAPGVARSLARSLGEGLAAAILGGAAAYGVLSYIGTLAPLTTLPIVLAEGALDGRAYGSSSGACSPRQSGVPRSY
jgi:ABC-type phosphate transport system permease subunit